MLRILFSSSKRSKKRYKPGTGEYFWDWFSENISLFERFIDSEQKDFTLIHKLSVHLGKYHKTLVGELYKNEKGKYTLVISPDGHKEGVQPANDLVAGRPALPNWSIVAFRQPREVEAIRLGDDQFTYPVSDVLVKPVKSGDNEVVDLMIYIKNMNRDENRYQQLAFLYLDNTIGEFNTIQRLRYVEFYEYQDNNAVENLMTLHELYQWMQSNYH